MKPASSCVLLISQVQSVEEILEHHIAIAKGWLIVQSCQDCRHLCQLTFAKLREFLLA